MSEENDSGTMLSCASCGIAEAEVDGIKLKKCTACYLVRYCGVECQRNRWPKHKQACKKRAAALRDELLFKQPESCYLGDCPICCLPLPLDVSKSTINYCCCTMICNGCVYADCVRMMREGVIKYTCPFCRATTPETNELRDKQRMKRIEANDPVAIGGQGTEQYAKGDYSGAFEYWKKAAEFGDVEAHCRLAAMYQLGRGVEKDRGKQMYHLEEAAIGGHPKARHLLGVKELGNGNVDRAVQHHVIAAKQGEDDSIKMLMDAFKLGFVSKDILASTLREHQAAVDATKSPQREAAEERYRNRAKK